MREGVAAAEMRRRFEGLSLPGLSLLAACAACAALLASATPASAKVLRVGSYNGKAGKFATIQAALRKAKPGDWILVGPGDYKEAGVTSPKGGRGTGGALLIEKERVHIRGMDRNSVIVDGTRPGTPQCSSAAGDQELGPLDKGGHRTGRNGIEVFKTAGVSVENLTACNFLSGSEGGGNQIWFNFGDGSGKQMVAAWRGAYLSATSQFYGGKEAPFGSYGIFVSNTEGPGIYTQVYANNMADSDFYIGACPNCNTILDHAHAESSSLGYSGTNSGGHLIIQNSEFNNNKSGFVSNSQNNDDQPSPQNGQCPKGQKGPTGTSNCWWFTKNSVHDNNNPNVPGTGSAEAGPVGTGVVLSGDRNNIVSGNLIYNNKAWGVLLAPYPDIGEPPAIAHCGGGTEGEINGKHVCYFDDWGNEVAGNLLKNNGGYGNPTNGDFAEIANAQPPTELNGETTSNNCWHGNIAENTPGKQTEPTSEPKEIQKTHGECGKADTGGEPLSSPLGVQVACDSEIFSEVVKCPGGPGFEYPRLKKVELIPVPTQKAMPNACLDVPRNPWCPRNRNPQPPYPVPGLPAE